MYDDLLNILCVPKVHSYDKLPFSGCHRESKEGEILSCANTWQNLFFLLSTLRISLLLLKLIKYDASSVY